MATFLEFQDAALHDDRWTPEDRGYKTLCWIWRCGFFTNGYGRIGHWKHSEIAHRTIYQEMIGPIAGGLDLDHLCRQRDCVNPAHLEPTTRAENLRRGEGTKLTAEAVREIRDAPRYWGVRKDLAEKFGVTVGYVAQLRSKNPPTWEGVI